MKKEIKKKIAEFLLELMKESLEAYVQAQIRKATIPDYNKQPYHPFYNNPERKNGN